MFGSSLTGLLAGCPAVAPPVLAACRTTPAAYNHTVRRCQCKRGQLRTDTATGRASRVIKATQKWWTRATRHENGITTGFGQGIQCSGPAPDNLHKPTSAAVAVIRYSASAHPSAEAHATLWAATPENCRASSKRLAEQHPGGGRGACSNRPGRFPCAHAPGMPLHMGPAHQAKSGEKCITAERFRTGTCHHFRHQTPRCQCVNGSRNFAAALHGDQDIISGTHAVQFKLNIRELAVGKRLKLTDSELDAENSCRATGAVPRQLGRGHNAPDPHRRNWRAGYEVARIRHLRDAEPVLPVFRQPCRQIFRVP